MKSNALILIIIVATLIVVSLMIYTTKGEAVLVSARYEMLACEHCDHWLVERSQNKALLNASISIHSKTIDTHSLINDAAIHRQTQCLKGKPYLFNPNLFGIKPDAIRFEVLSIEPEAACAQL